MTRSRTNDSAPSTNDSAQGRNASAQGGNDSGPGARASGPGARASAPGTRASAPGARASAAPNGTHTPEDAPEPSSATAEGHLIPFQNELFRKALHLLSLVIPLGIWPIGRTFGIVACGLAAVCALAADVARVRSKHVAGLVRSVFGSMMRPEECPGVGGPIRLNGATWVLLAAALLVIVLPLEIAIISFTVFMIADAAAAVVGLRLGRHKWPGSIRTLEGSLAFFLTGTAVMLLFGSHPVWVVCLVTLAGTAAEIPSGPLNDNLRVPFVIGMAIYVLEMFAA